jgi:hypothetical protein
MNIDQIEAELKHLSTKESLSNLRADIHKDFGDFRVDLHKSFGDFKADLIKTLWQTQLSIAGLILVGVGLIIHFHV